MSWAASHPNKMTDESSDVISLDWTNPRNYLHWDSCTLYTSAEEDVLVFEIIIVNRDWERQ